MTIIPFFFDVLAYSAIFVLVVLGLGVIASMMGIFNFAHGEFTIQSSVSENADRIFPKPFQD